MDRIAELRAEIGEEDVLLILRLYLEEAAEMLDGLPASGPEAERRLHFIRSGALNLGLAGMVRAAGHEATAEGLAAALGEARAAVGTLEAAA